MTDDLETVRAVRDMLEEMAQNPLAAADRLDAMAVDIHGLAERLRQQPASGYRDPGGMADRVRISVVGPDGQTKQETDTGA